MKNETENQTLKTKEQLGVELMERLHDYVEDGNDFRKKLFDLMNTAVMDSFESGSNADGEYLGELSNFYWNMGELAPYLDEYDKIYQEERQTKK